MWQVAGGILIAFAALSVLRGLIYAFSSSPRRGVTVIDVERAAKKLGESSK